MLALEPVLCAELQAVPALADVFSIRAGTDAEASRRTVPAIEVSFEGVSLQASNDRAAKVSVGWGVHIIVRRSPTAALELDAALAQVIACLLNFKPGMQGARHWSALKLVPGGSAVQRPEFVEQGLAEYAVIFETSAVYNGRE